MYDPENAQVVQVLSSLPTQVRTNIEIIDTGYLIGRLKAWINGVDQVPTVIIDKQETSGIRQVKQVFLEIIN